MKLMEIIDRFHCLLCMVWGIILIVNIPVTDVPKILYDLVVFLFGGILLFDIRINVSVEGGYILWTQCLI